MEDVWQEKRDFVETNLHMLNNNVLCNVTFLVGTNKAAIKAHKFMLASRTPVFYAMFCGPMSETSSTIEIPDIERGTMNDILRFIYTEDCTVNGQSVMELLYAAKKYSIKRLEQKCQTFLAEHISCENVCFILAQAHILNEMELKHCCFNLILTKGEHVLKTEGFRTLPKELLKEILESDDINIAEEDIYEGCKQWATYQLRDADGYRDTSHSEIRNILGDLLYLVRFPNMPMETFSTKCVCDDILSLEEKVSIFQFIAAKDNGGQCKFSNKRRVSFKNKIISRFISKGEICWSYSGNADAIDFIVSETAFIFGIGLWSPYESGSVKGVVSLLRDNNNVLMDKEVEITYSQSKCQEEVLFDECVYLEPGNKYTIKVLLQGSQTFCGSNGLNEITDGDFSIKFSHSRISKNCTSVVHGQIPLLILGIRQTG